MTPERCWIAPEAKVSKTSPAETMEDEAAITKEGKNPSLEEFGRVAGNLSAI